MKLRISNSGEIDSAALFLLGASSKEGDQSKIGFFGSGNKYALATLLRKGIPFDIYSGTRRIDITLQPVDFRGETFEQICLDGQPTSFTTRMGPTWETWFALREFVCNAIDEGGFELSLVQTDLGGVEGTTQIYVDYAPEVAQFFSNLEDYIYTGPNLFEAVTTYGKIAILEGTPEGVFNIYRKGVCVRAQGSKDKSLFRYDCDSLEINESRVVVYDYQIREAIASILAKAPLEIVQKFLAHRDEASLRENSAYWSYNHEKFSDAWPEAIGTQIVMAESLRDYAPSEDVAEAIVLPDDLVKQLQTQFTQLNFWGKQGGDYREVECDSELPAQAQAEVISWGYLADSMPIKMVKFKASNVMGSFDKTCNTLCLSVDFLDDYDELVSTVLEEACHIKGHRDGSREFEQYLCRELVGTHRRIKALEGGQECSSPS